MTSSPILQSKHKEDINDWKNIIMICIQLSDNRMELIKGEEVLKDY